MVTYVDQRRRPHPNKIPTTLNDPCGVRMPKEDCGAPSKRVQKKEHDTIYATTRSQLNSLLAEVLGELGELLAPGEAGVFGVLELETLRKKK